MTKNLPRRRKTMTTTYQRSTSRTATNSPEPNTKARSKTVRAPENGRRGTTRCRTKTNSMTMNTPTGPKSGWRSN